MDITEASVHYSPIWTVNRTTFPYIFIDVLDLNQIAKFGLLLNLRNYNFLPPLMTIMHTNYRGFIKIEDIPLSTDTFDGRRHIWVDSNTNFIWFCMPGTSHYHKFYPEDPWEQIRYTEQGKILTLINGAINFIDRSKL